MKAKLITASIVVILLMPFLFGGCANDTSKEGFAIYLTNDNNPVAQMEALSHIELADTPVISSKDIVSYNWETHDILLTPGAYSRLEAMHVPVNGTAFVVCVDKTPLYWGAFWAPFSSLSFSGVVIMIPSIHGENIINIELGYPSADFASGEDPRSSTVIKEALQKAGKLKG